MHPSVLKELQENLRKTRCGPSGDLFYRIALLRRVNERPGQRKAAYDAVIGLEDHQQR